MKILITGGTGFIGSHLVSKLKRNNEIFLLTRRKIKHPDIEEKNIFCFNQNISDLCKFILDNGIEGIIHLATNYIAQHKPEDIKDLIESNIYLGTALLEAAVAGNVKWFLNIGTIWQNYNSPAYSDEYNPVNLYAATKQALLTLAKYYTEISSLKFITLKLCDTYGEGDTRKKIIDLFRENSKNGYPLEMSKGYQLIDIVHVSEVLNGITNLIKLLNTNPDRLKEEYVITSGEQISLRELAKKYEIENGVKLNIIWGARPYRKREVMIPYQGNRIPGKDG